MKLEKAIEELTRIMRRARYSEKSIESYVGWVCRFFRFVKAEAKHGRRYLLESGEVDLDARAAAYLSAIAPKVAASTQTQALCALVYFRREVCGKPFGKLPDWVSAKRPKTLPEWVTPAEALAIFNRMSGVARTMAELQFGAGLRLKELVALRIKDLRLEEGSIVVRRGKNNKDRVTLLPHSLVPALREAVARSTQYWEDDRRDGVPGVFLPDGIATKYPGYATRLEWHWVFPSYKLSVDPISGVTRRHHVHPDLLNKAIGTACAKARLGRRVTSHALRHGFATALLASGRTIEEVRELLGHASIETTQIYLHCLPRLEERLESPLDAARNVAEFRRSA